MLQPQHGCRMVHDAPRRDPDFTAGAQGGREGVRQDRFAGDAELRFQQLQVGERERDGGNEIRGIVWLIACSHNQAAVRTHAQ